MKPSFRKSESESANITILAIIMLFVLSLVGATVLLNTTTRYNGSMKVGGWQEALPAAEAGADVGLTNCRWTVVSGTTAFDTSNGWSLVDPTNTQGNNITYSSPLGYSYTLPAQYTIPTLQQTGQGTVQTWAKVVVDGPSTLIDSQGNQWFRIRSTGYANLTGLAHVSIDNPTDPNARHTNALRKFSFNIDRFTGAALAVPRTTRTIEAIAQPQTSFGAAIVANSSLKGVNSGFRLDSFDSRDPAKSTNGQYDAAKSQSNGNIYSNSTSLPATISGDIWGNVYTAASSIISTATIHGTTNLNSTSYYTPPVLAPTWTSILPTPSGNFIAGTTASPNYYKCSGSKNVNITAPAGGAAGAVNIWFTDDFTGSVTVPVNVTCKIWISGDMKTPNINNLNNNAAYLQLYGINYVGQKWETKDTTGYYALIYAPAAQIKTGAGDIYGAIIGNDVNIKNDVHYDEAFAPLGTTIDYARASWVEDPR